MDNRLDNLLSLVKTYKDIKDKDLADKSLSEILDKSFEAKKDSFIGPMGPKGESGLKGDIGPRGLQGPKGNTGTGIESIKIKEEEYQAKLEIKTTDGKILDLGNIKGPRGQRGKQGDIGPRGLAGPLGPEGQPGAQGESFKYAGVYRIGKKYRKGDVVQSTTGALYLSLKENNSAPLTDKTSWEMILPFELNQKSVGGSIAWGSIIGQWGAGGAYTQDQIVWHTDAKLYRATRSHIASASHQSDYLVGAWMCLSDQSATQPLDNDATAVIPSLGFLPTDKRVVIADIINMRRTSTVAAAYFKLVITLIWDGVAWIKAETDKAYFPGTADAITYTVSTEVVTNRCIVSYTTPLLAGVYDSAFSRMVISFRSVP